MLKYSKHSQEAKNRISESMAGNMNALGNIGNTHGKKWRIDHKKVLKKLKWWCNKESRDMPVVKSAAYLLFIDAGLKKQVEYMKRVRKVLK